ncbi:MAG: hypothetical protein QW474_00035 [Candidatus Aenigmatarchaeota archaeon]
MRNFFQTYFSNSYSRFIKKIGDKEVLTETEFNLLVDNFSQDVIFELKNKTELIDEIISDDIVDKIKNNEFDKAYKIISDKIKLNSIDFENIEEVIFVVAYIYIFFYSNTILYKRLKIDSSNEHSEILKNLVIKFKKFAIFVFNKIIYLYENQLDIDEKNEKIEKIIWFLKNKVRIFVQNLEKYIQTKHQNKSDMEDKERKDEIKNLDEYLKRLKKEKEKKLDEITESGETKSVVSQGITIEMPEIKEGKEPEEKLIEFVEVQQQEKSESELQEMMSNPVEAIGEYVITQEEVKEKEIHDEKEKSLDLEPEQQIEFEGMLKEKEIELQGESEEEEEEFETMPEEISISKTIEDEHEKEIEKAEIEHKQVTNILITPEDKKIDEKLNYLLECCKKMSASQSNENLVFEINTSIKSLQTSIINTIQSEFLRMKSYFEEKYRLLETIIEISTGEKNVVKRTLGEETEDVSKVKITKEIEHEQKTEKDKSKVLIKKQKETSIIEPTRELVKDLFTHISNPKGKEKVSMPDGYLFYSLDGYLMVKYFTNEDYLKGLKVIEYDKNNKKHKDFGELNKIVNKLISKYKSSGSKKISVTLDLISDVLNKNKGKHTTELKLTDDFIIHTRRLNVEYLYSIMEKNNIRFVTKGFCSSYSGGEYLILEADNIDGLYVLIACGIKL